MPPPCCTVTAAFCRAEKMPGIESSIGPMTKQLKRVTLRSVPTPAWMRPPGRNLKSSRMPRKRSAQTAWASSGSTAASAVAMRRQVSAIVRSSRTPSRWRYLVLQT
jgi:hypothetical protein